LVGGGKSIDALPYGSGGGGAASQKGGAAWEGSEKGGRSS